MGTHSDEDEGIRTMTSCLHRECSNNEYSDELLDRILLSHSLVQDLIARDLTAHDRARLQRAAGDLQNALDHVMAYRADNNHDL